MQKKNDWKIFQLFQFQTIPQFHSVYRNTDVVRAYGLLQVFKLSIFSISHKHVETVGLPASEQIQIHVPFDAMASESGWFSFFSDDESCGRQIYLPCVRGRSLQDWLILYIVVCISKV